MKLQQTHTAESVDNSDFSRLDCKRDLCVWFHLNVGQLNWCPIYFLRAFRLCLRGDHRSDGAVYCTGRVCGRGSVIHSFFPLIFPFCLGVSLLSCLSSLPTSFHWEFRHFASSFCKFGSVPISNKCSLADTQNI